MTISTARDYLKKFFSQTSKDTVSLEEVYAIYDRLSEDEETNKTWIGNKLTYMKKYDYVHPLYGKNETNTRVLIGLKLGNEGKRELAASHADSDHQAIPQHGSNRQTSMQVFIDESGKVSVSEVVEQIKKLRKQYPEFEITFDMKLKNI